MSEGTTRTLRMLIGIAAFIVGALSCPLLPDSVRVLRGFPLLGGMSGGLGIVLLLPLLVQHLESDDEKFRRMARGETKRKS